MTEMIIYITITCCFLDNFLNILTRGKESKVINILKYLLSGVRYILLFVSLYLTRFDNIRVNTPLLFILYGLVVFTSILKITILPHAKRDVVIQWFIMLCVIPFILMDVKGYDVFDMMEKNSPTVSNYWDGQWNIKYFMDVYLLVMFLIMPIVDNIKAIALLFVSIYLYCSVLLDLDILKNGFIEVVGSSIIALLLQAFFGSLVTTMTTKFTTDVVLDTQVDVPLIEVVEKRKPGRPKGSKDSYMRTRRTKKEIEEARAKGE